VSPNPKRKAGQQRPGRLRVLCCPRPPLRSFTKEMGTRGVGIFNANARTPSGRCWTGGILSRFLRSQLRRIGLGHPLQARPRSGQSVSMAMPCPIRNCSRGPRSEHAGAPVSTSPPTRSLPKEDLGIPRRPVDRRCGANPAPAILDVPTLGATPRRSVSAYDKQEYPRAFGHFLT
jgi:hypothetical protein